MSTNVCAFCGRLTDNPDIATMPNGKERSRFRIAVDRDYKKEDGTRPCDFFSIVKWGSAEFLRVTHLAKGDKVIVVGRMENNEWTGDDGMPRKGFVLNCERIELVNKYRRDKDKDQSANAAAAETQQATFDQGDDDLPF